MLVCNIKYFMRFFCELSRSMQVLLRSRIDQLRLIYDTRAEICFRISPIMVYCIAHCQGRNLRGVWGVSTPPQSTNPMDWQGESSGLAGQSKILNDRYITCNLQGFQRELNIIYRPKFYRYWSKNKGFNHVLIGICPEKIFDP